MDDEDELDETFFVNELPRDLRCPVCLYVLKDPCQISCGHRFCSKCIQDLKKQSGSAQLACPVDRQLAMGDIFPDMAVKRHINSLKVKCLNVKKGCGWIGDLVDRKTHLKTCKYISHNCPMCGLLLQSFELEFHQDICPKRLVECKYCKLKFPLNNMDIHFGDCNLFPMTCPNGCSDSLLIPRSLIPEHLQNECPLKLLSCSLEAFGCVEKIRRREMGTHLEKCAIKRISSLANVVLKHEKSIKQLKESLEESKQSFERLDTTCYPCQGQFTWKIIDITRKVQIAQSGTLENPADSYLYSPPFYTGEAGYKLCLCVYPAGDKNQAGCLSLYFVIMRGPYDDILQWPFQKHVRLVLINCRGGHSLVKDINPDPRLHYFRRPKEEKNVGYGYPRFIPLHKLISEDSEFASNDSIFIRATVYQ